MRDARRSAVGVAALSFAYLLAHPFAIGRADESHLLYGAKRILDGEVIYRDFYETLTPLGFYFFAALFRVAGTTIVTARVTMALIEAVAAGLLFQLVRRVAGTAAGVVATLVLVGLCIPVWPYASLHWMSTTFGLLVATVVLSPRTIESSWESSWRRPFAAGLVAGVAVCSQQQRGVFIAAWVPVGFAVLAQGLPRGRRLATLVPQIAWSAAGGVLVAALVLGQAAHASSPAALWDGLVGFAFKHYGPTFSGGGWAAVLPFTQANLRSTSYWLLRASPSVLIVEGLVLLARLHRPWTRPDLERASLWLLGTMMVGSIVYLTDIIHVSFVLPFMLLPAAALVEDLRTRLPRARTAITAAVWLVALAAGAKAAANVRLAHELNPARFATAFGTVQGPAALRDLYEATRRNLPVTPGRRPVLYSYPDDAWLYLACDADNPTRFNALVVGFFPPEHVDEVVQALRARRPDAVVLLYPATPPPIRPAVEETYRAVQDVDLYRVYVPPQK